MSKFGILYLIPSSLGENTVHTIPNYNIHIIDRLEYFIAERAKTARHFIKACLPEKNMSPLQFEELNKRTQDTDLKHFMKPLFEGKDMGLLSEAGCPGVADPGSKIVKLAHQNGIKVVPLTGPSSILLALMASGMNGQNFAFVGYLPPKKNELAKTLKQLESRSTKFNQTQIFIETPYRNNQMLEVATQTLSAQTNFCVAMDLTLPTEYIKTQRIAQWKQETQLDFHKRLGIFLMEG
ncbi:MAG: SAM-dependent methyltransferase [Bacteroidota bacterium]